MTAGEPPAQAAAGMTPGEEQALGVLRALWEPEYLVGYDEEHGWWASRAGVTGHLLVAPGPEELSRELAGDSGAGR